MVTDGIVRGGDVAFDVPDMYEALEAEGYLYAIRLKANAVLYREIQHLLRRPVGRPPSRPIVSCHDFPHQAGSWEKPRQVVAKIEWHRSELFPRVGFIVTNLRRRAGQVVKSTTVGARRSRGSRKARTR